MKEEKQQSSVRFSGLTAQAVQASRDKCGANVLAPPPRVAWWKQLLSKFDDPVIRILMLAAVISLVTGEFLEAIGILIAILLATGLAFLNEFKAEREFDILNQVNDDIPVKAIRDSQFQLVPKRDLVVGDVIFLELGEEVPADGTVLESVNLQVDQSKLTGESDPVHKFNAAEAAGHASGEETYPVTMVLRGTPIVDGHGYVEITAVGAHTEIGKTAVAATMDTAEVTPLNQQLEQLGKLIGVVGFSIAAVTFAALVTHGILVGTIVQNASQWILSAVLLVAILVALGRVWMPVMSDGIAVLRRKPHPGVAKPSTAAKRFWLLLPVVGLAIGAIGVGGLWLAGGLSGTVSEWIARNALEHFINYFMIAVTLIVVSVPEGLAMSVTLSLAYSMRKMTAANNLVRKMHACETIGAATVICTDKTGTLTKNEMHVQHAEFPRQDLPFIATAIAANSTANLSFTEAGKPQPLGNPTEGALLLWLHGQKYNYETIREEFAIATQWTFSTERKFMATAGKLGEENVLFAKGAPEILLARCAQMTTAENGNIALTDAAKTELLHAMRQYQARGMRTLGFAYLNDPATAGELADVAWQMTWMGFVAIADPVREDVPAAISDCNTAGIQVKMVTGDNPETAKEIGRQIHLWEDATCTADQIITGVEFAALSDDDALKASRKLRIMARARPNDKLRLVRCLKASGEIIAVTGDGTNDAPALNYSDVGIAMGKTGTSIAKEASDIILLDDSFTSIVNAVMWGRSLYRNIQKFIVFQLTVNVVALSTAMLGPFLGVELPLTVIQMLWINLIMDTFAALALATDPPDPAVLKLPPRRNTAFIVTKAMWQGIFGIGFFFIATLIGLLVYMKNTGNAEDLRWLTIFFSVLVMLQFWNLFNAKCWGSKDSIFKHLADNPAFILIAAGIFVAQILLVQVGGSIFRTIPLNVVEWLLVITGTSLILWLGEGVRAIQRRQVRVAG